MTSEKKITHTHTHTHTHTQPPEFRELKRTNGTHRLDLVIFSEPTREYSS